MQFYLTYKRILLTEQHNKYINVYANNRLYSLKFTVVIKCTTTVTTIKGNILTQVNQRQTLTNQNR